MTTFNVVPSVEVLLKIISEENVMSQYTIREGDKLTGLTYMEKGEEVTVDGIVDAILVDKQQSPVGVGTILDGRSTNPEISGEVCPVSRTTPFVLTASGMIVDIASALHSKHILVKFADVVSIGSVAATNKIVTPESLPEGGVAAVLAEVEEGATITLAAGSYAATEALTIDKSVAFVGPNDVPQGPIKARSAELPGAVMDAPITIDNPEAEVSFRGLTFTGATFPVVNAAKEVSFVNCRFEGQNPTAAKTYGIKTAVSETPIKMTVSGCYFGAPVADATGKLYNLFELNTPLASGSSFRDLYFDVDGCTHNFINIYDCADNAVVTIDNCYAAVSKNMIRLGVKGAKAIKLNINNCSYAETDQDVAWAGVMLMQPYGKATTDMSKWVININKLDNKSGVDQVAYLYFGKTDMPYDETKLPSMFVDGVAYEYPIINDQTPANTEPTTTA